MLVSAIAGAVDAAPVFASTNWLQSGFNGGHTHYNPNETVIGSGNVGSLAPRWSKTVGGAVGSFLSPVAARKLIFFSGTHRLYSVHPDTGANHWSVPLENAGAPVIAGSTIAALGLDAAGVPHLQAFDTGSGQLKWSVDRNALAEIAADLNTIYVSTGKQLYAYDAVSGALRWDTALTGCSYSSPASGPIVAGGKVFVGCYDGNLLALDSASGTLLWSTPVGPVQRSPAAQGNLVYVSSENGWLYAVNVADGSLRWSAQAGASNFYHSPAVANGIVYAVASSGTIYAFNKSNGTPLWTAPYAGNSNPAIANGVLYIGGGAGINAYDAVTGTPLPTPQVQASTVVSDPVIVNGQLYVVENGSTVRLKAFAPPP